MTEREKWFYQQMWVALKRITEYETPKQLRVSSDEDYGLGYAEALEYAYENIQSEAKAGLRGVRKPTAAAPQATHPTP